MNMRKNLILLIAVLLLSLWVSCMAAGTTFASGSDVTQPPFPPMFGMAGICTDQTYLYAVAAGKIMEYALTDMSLVRTVDLPEPPAPPSVSATGTDAGSCASGNCPPHPPFARSQWLLTSGGSLYIMAGPMIYRYSIPDLVLQGSVDLPKPELP